MKRKCGQGRYRLLAVTAVLCFHVSVTFLVFYLSLFRVGFIQAESVKYQVQERLGITSDELLEATEKMIAYVRGHSSDLDVAVTVDGSSIPFFTDRDRMHLQDIAVMVRWGKGLCAIGLGIVLISSFFLCKQGQADILCGTYLFLWLVVLAIAVFLGIWIVNDLQGFINGFHRLFFKNDTWILNPATDRLIWLFPTRIFQDGAMILGIWMAIVHLTVTAAAVLELILSGKRKRRKKF